MKCRVQAQSAIESLQEETGRGPKFIKTDLGDLESVKAATKDFPRVSTVGDRFELMNGWV